MQKLIVAVFVLSLATVAVVPPADASAASIGPRSGDTSRSVTLRNGRKAFVSARYIKRRGVSGSRACQMKVTISRAGWTTWSKRFTNWSSYHNKNAFGTITYVGASASPTTVRVTVDTNGKCYYSVGVL